MAGASVLLLALALLAGVSPEVMAQNEPVDRTVVDCTEVGCATCAGDGAGGCAPIGGTTGGSCASGTSCPSCRCLFKAGECDCA